MSSRWIGGPKHGRRYPDSGTPSLTYFRRNKHHRVGRICSFRPLRWRLYIAKGWMIERRYDQLDKKQQNVLSNTTQSL